MVANTTPFLKKYITQNMRRNTIFNYNCNFFAYNFAKNKLRVKGQLVVSQLASRVKQALAMQLIFQEVRNFCDHIFSKDLFNSHQCGSCFSSFFFSSLTDIPYFRNSFLEIFYLQMVEQVDGFLIIKDDFKHDDSKVKFLKFVYYHPL